MSIASLPTASELDRYFDAIGETFAATAQRLSSFFQTFDRTYREARAVRAATTPHFDLLRIFSLEFSELRHSDVIAWFLDPNAAHEQGGFFADALLRQCGDSVGAVDTHLVVRERHGRVDAAMYAPGEFALFIENKVRHFEREQQVADMVASMAGVAAARGIPVDRRYAVFLTDTGKSAVTGPLMDSHDFHVRNLKSLSRLEVFQSFRIALLARGGFSPLLMNFIESYIASIQRVSAQLSEP